MQTDRLTILMDPKYTSAVASRAAARGVSTSEHVRNALDSFNGNDGEEQAQLAALVAEANTAIPKIAASIERMTKRLEEMNRKDEEFLKKMGMAG